MKKVGEWGWLVVHLRQEAKLFHDGPSYLNFYYTQSVIQLIGEGQDYVLSRLFNATKAQAISFEPLKIQFSCSSDFRTWLLLVDSLSKWVLFLLSWGLREGEDGGCRSIKYYSASKGTISGKSFEFNLKIHSFLVTKLRKSSENEWNKKSEWKGQAAGLQNGEEARSIEWMGFKGKRISFQNDGFLSLPRALQSTRVLVAYHVPQTLTYMKIW